MLGACNNLAKLDFINKNSKRNSKKTQKETQKKNELAEGEGSASPFFGYIFFLVVTW